jgi:hypothetical protein
MGWVRPAQRYLLVQVKLLPASSSSFIAIHYDGPVHNPEDKVEGKD